MFKVEALLVITDFRKKAQEFQDTHTYTPQKKQNKHCFDGKHLLFQTISLEINLTKEQFSG